jgi:hypothetical protein
MDGKINLADPDFEPSDEQLQELMRRAFSNLVEEDELRLRLMRERIAAGRIELLKQLRQETAQSV